MKFRKVCFFLPSGHRDGAELSALECMEALQSLGMQVHVVIPQKGPLIAELQARQLPYKYIPYKVWIEPPVPVVKGLLVTLWNLLITLVAVLMVGRWRCDLIITNTININVGALVAKLLGLPHIWYLREFGHEDHGWRFHLGEKPALWLMDRLSIFFLAVSRAVAEKYQAGVTPSKVHYLYQPINVNVDSPEVTTEKPQDQFTCIMVGRLQQGKRQEDALRAMAELRDQGLRVHLWLVGGRDPDYGHFLDNMAGEHNLQAQVKFIGQVDNALPYIQQADVLLLCSRCEAFARVVIEAMKAGKPVIGTSSGGTVEQITEGFNGLLYEPQNYRELAEKIRYLYHHPDKVQEMGGQAQKWARQNFTRERYQEKIKEVFASL